MSNLQQIAEQIKLQIEIGKLAKEQIRKGTQKDAESEAKLQELYAEQRKLEATKN